MYEVTDIKSAVRERYAGDATVGSSCCGPSASSTSCGCGAAESVSPALSYDESELAAIPDGAYVACLSGAIMRNDYHADEDQLRAAAALFQSIRVSATKPTEA